MYHIKPDKRSQISANELISGLNECLKTKPLHTVTISDIHRVTGISRATFYRLFDTPEDIILYQFDCMAEEVVRYYEANGQSHSIHLLEQVILLCMRHEEVLKAVINNDRVDFLFHYAKKITLLLKTDKRIFPDTISEQEQNTILEQLSLALAVNLIAWIKNGQKSSAPEFIEFIKKCAYITVAMLEDAEEHTAYMENTIPAKAEIPINTIG